MGNKNAHMEAKIKAREWQWQLKMESKHLDKEIKKVKQGEERLQREIQAQAQQNNVQGVQMLAKSIVQSRKAVARMEKTKTTLHVVNLQLTTSVASMTTTSSVRLSADIMRMMNQIAKTPEIGETMEKMRREMSRCAEAESVIEDALRDDSVEEDAAVEVQRLLEEMALDRMGPLARPEPAAASAAAAAPVPAAASFAPPARQLVAEAATPAGAVPPRAAAGPARQAPGTELAPPAVAGGRAGDEDDELLRRLQVLSDPADAALGARAAPDTLGHPGALPPPAPGGGVPEDDELLRRIEMLKH